MSRKAIDAYRLATHTVWGVTVAVLVGASVASAVVADGESSPTLRSVVSREAWITLVSVAAMAATFGMVLRKVWRVARIEVETRTRALADGARSVLWSSRSTERVIEYVSPDASMGYPTQEWYGDGFWARHIHPEDRERAHSSVSERDGSWRLQYRMIAADGRIVWVDDVSVTERHREGGWISRGQFTDITDSTQAATLTSRRADTEAAAAISAGVAHELGTILFAASMSLLQAAPGGVLEKGSSIERSNALIQDAQRLAGSLLDFLSQGESDDVRLRSLRRWISDSVAKIVETMPAEVRVTIDVSLDLPDVKAHSLGLEQVLRTLLFNAATAMGGRGEIRVSAQRVVVSGRDLVEIRICDRGPGVAQELRSLIFDPGVTTNKRSIRSGLGLAIAKQILNHFGGTIAFEPGVPSGSTFVICLMPESGADV